jgi:acetyl-CoA C-acetyltransferase
LAEHQRRLGVLCGALSAVAAQNAYAWFPRARSAEEIATPTASNRMVGFPYTKYMNAIMEVDQAAGVLMTSVGHARALGIPPARWVYLRGAADAHDLWHVVERVGYAESPAIRAAGRAALTMAGVTIDEVAHLDLYSCFPSAVQLGRDALGIPIDDPRPLTVTGGLPYAGGPGNNYTMHAIATMLDRLRAAPGSVGLVSGLGWYVTKHAVGVYSTEPGTGPWRAPDTHALQAALDATPHPPLAREPSGAASIETYTVVHDRDGVPVRGFVIGRLADGGARFVAHTPSDRPLLEGLVAREAVGLRGRAAHAQGTNTFVPD